MKGTRRPAPPAYTGPMTFAEDLTLLAVLLGFVALCVAYVRACDRIIGPDDEAELESGEATTPRTP